MDELICKLNNCINEIDDIADDLHYVYEVDATELNKISDFLFEFNKKLKGRME